MFKDYVIVNGYPVDTWLVEALGNFPEEYDLQGFQEAYLQQMDELDARTGYLLSEETLIGLVDFEELGNRFYKGKKA